MNNAAKRPFITLCAGKILHDGKPCRVVLTPELISIGCTDIDIPAARFLLQKWEERFGAAVTKFVLQEGESQTVVAQMRGSQIIPT